MFLVFFMQVSICCQLSVRKEFTWEAVTLPTWWWTETLFSKCWLDYFYTFLLLFKDFNRWLVYLSLCSGQSAATSPGWKQIWPYQLSALTHTHHLKIKSDIKNAEVEQVYLHVIIEMWWKETLSPLKAINSKMSSLKLPVVTRIQFQVW